MSPTHKKAQGVYGTRLNSTWNIVGPGIRQIILRHNINYSSIDVVRFITFDANPTPKYDFVTIWVGVYPGSTTVAVCTRDKGL